MHSVFFAGASTLVLFAALQFCGKVYASGVGRPFSAQSTLDLYDQISDVELQIESVQYERSLLREQQRLLEYRLDALQQRLLLRASVASASPLRPLQPLHPVKTSRQNAAKSPPPGPPPQEPLPPIPRRHVSPPPPVQKEYIEDRLRHKNSQQTSHEHISRLSPQLLGPKMEKVLEPSQRIYKMPAASASDARVTIDSTHNSLGTKSWLGLKLRKKGSDRNFMRDK